VEAFNKFGDDLRGPKITVPIMSSGDDRFLGEVSSCES